MAAARAQRCPCDSSKTKYSSNPLHREECSEVEAATRAALCRCAAGEQRASTKAARAERSGVVATAIPAASGGLLPVIPVFASTRGRCASGGHGLGRVTMPFRPPRNRCA